MSAKFGIICAVRWLCFYFLVKVYSVNGAVIGFEKFPISDSKSYSDFVKVTLHAVVHEDNPYLVEFLINDANLTRRNILLIINSFAINQ